MIRTCPMVNVDQTARQLNASSVGSTDLRRWARRAGKGFPDGLRLASRADRIPFDAVADGPSD